jgi:hypothetical protein
MAVAAGGPPDSPTARTPLSGTQLASPRCAGRSAAAIASTSGATAFVEDAHTRPIRRSTRDDVSPIDTAAATLPTSLAEPARRLAYQTLTHVVLLRITRITGVGGRAARGISDVLIGYTDRVDRCDSDAARRPMQRAWHPGETFQRGTREGCPIRRSSGPHHRRSGRPRSHQGIRWCSRSPAAEGLWRGGNASQTRHYGDAVARWDRSSDPDTRPVRICSTHADD